MRHDILALERTDRHDPHVGHAESADQRDAFVLDCLEHALVETDQVHLVDRDDNVADTEQRDDEGVPAGLHLHATRGVHQDHRQVHGRGAGRHIARVLLVPRAVRDDVLAHFGVEVSVSDVDRDALLALGLQAVHEQREVHRVAGCSPFTAVRGHRRKRVFEDLLRVMQQPPDQRALAVVHAAAGDEAQQVLGLVTAQEVVELDGGHQK